MSWHRPRIGRARAPKELYPKAQGKPARSAALPWVPLPRAPVRGHKPIRKPRKPKETDLGRFSINARSWHYYREKPSKESKRKKAVKTRPRTRQSYSLRQN